MYRPVQFLHNASSSAKIVSRTKNNSRLLKRCCLLLEALLFVMARLRFSTGLSCYSLICNVIKELARNWRIKETRCNITKWLLKIKICGLISRLDLSAVWPYPANQKYINSIWINIMISANVLLHTCIVDAFVCTWAGMNNLQYVKWALILGCHYSDSSRAVHATSCNQVLEYCTIMEVRGMSHKLIFVLTL